MRRSVCTLLLGVVSLSMLAAGAASAQGLPYPTRTPYDIKAIGIEPGGTTTVPEVAGNRPGTIAMNFPWDFYEPYNFTPPCPASSDWIQYDGRCYYIQPSFDAQIRAYAAWGVRVTGILYGVPDWARTAGAGSCSPAFTNGERFCKPDNPADFARFAGMIAKYYDGITIPGVRIADFVIHNEVNRNEWFDIGCGQGVPCNQTTWLDVYAANFNAAYDRIKAEQAAAKVFVSLNNEWSNADNPNGGTLSGRTVVSGLAARAGGRAWSVAVHPYTVNFASPVFTVDDAPYVTPGTIGQVAGWLRATFPSTPSAWEVHMTEGGLDGATWNESAQSSYLCEAFRNVLGTPGVDNYVYSPLPEHPLLLANGWYMGLKRTNDTWKPAWATWALANRIDVGITSCGFERLPYVKLTRYYNPSRGHWVSTRLPPAGSNPEGSWGLLRQQQAGTHLIYECAVNVPGSGYSGTHTFLDRLPTCGGLQPMGPLGYAYDGPGSGRLPLYRCRVGPGYSHFASTDPNCEGQAMEDLLGYVISPF
jgi:hypothetical protein